MTTRRLAIRGGKRKIFKPLLVFAGETASSLPHGSVYTPQPLPERFKRGAANECFQNALVLAVNEDLVFIEGYALGKGTLPVHHAWCAEPGSSLAIDNTWGDGEGRAYFGVAFDTAYVAAAKGSAIHGWQSGYRLLKGEVTEAEWRYRP